MRNFLDLQFTVLITSLLLFVMLWPIDQVSPNVSKNDKIIHSLAFSVLVAPFAWTERFNYLAILFSAVAFGFLVELIQPIFGRVTSINDWLANVLGVIIGISIVMTIKKIKLRMR